MPVSSAYGGTVPLSSVADVTVEQAAQSITRHNQTRQVTITGDTISGDSTAITKPSTKFWTSTPCPRLHRPDRRCL